MDPVVGVGLVMLGVGVVMLSELWLGPTFISILRKQNRDGEWSVGKLCLGQLLNF